MLEELAAFKMEFNHLRTEIADIKRLAYHNKNLIDTALKTIADIRDVSYYHKNMTDNLSKTVTDIRDVSYHHKNLTNNLSKTVTDIRDVSYKHKNTTDTALGILNDNCDLNTRQYAELMYTQLLHDSINGSMWLKDQAFSLYGWAANYGLIYLLFRVLDQIQPTQILEFGMGQTSKLTTQYITNKNSKAHLDLVEHNPDWIQAYSSQLIIDDRANVHQLTLDIEKLNEVEYTRYNQHQLAQITAGKKYDLIIIDGPVGSQIQSRSNILDLIDCLNQDFIIIFDDAGRPGEKDTIEKTLQLLTNRGVEYATFERISVKEQFVITSPSYAFVGYL